jgi:hypothetical protein
LFFSWALLLESSNSHNQQLILARLLVPLRFDAARDNQ